MANFVSVNVYQINQTPLTAVQAIGFPTTGLLLRDCSSSPTKVLPTGTVNSVIQTPNGSQYYCSQTLAALITLLNA
jgi:hypothetical protein